MGRKDRNQRTSKLRKNDQSIHELKILQLVKESTVYLFRSM